MKKILLRLSIVLYIAIFIGVVVYSINQDKPEPEELSIIGKNINVQSKQSIYQAYETVKDFESDWFPSPEVKKNPVIYIVGENDSIFKQLLIEGNYGLYIPLSNKLYLSELMDEEQFHDVFIHEYNHFLFDRYLETKKIDFELFPQWFVEGAAESFTFDVIGKVLIDQELFEAVPFEDLELLNEDNSYVIYQQGFFALRQLVAEFGPSIFSDIIQKTAEYNNFEQAFNELTSYELTEYHTLFENSTSQFFELYDLASENPDELILQLNAYVEKMGDITPYFTDIFDLYSTAYLTKQDFPTSALYAEKIIELTDNPFDYLRAAELIENVNPQRAKIIVEEGYELITQLDYPSTVVESYERRMNEWE